MIGSPNSALIDEVAAQLRRDGQERPVMAWHRDLRRREPLYDICQSKAVFTPALHLLRELDPDD